MPRRSFSVKLPPPKPRNSERRAREYLTPSEVENLLRAARQRGRYGQRDATLLPMYRHGLRVAEVVGLRWDMLDLKTAVLYVRRVENGAATVHPLRGPELRALRQLQHAAPGMAYVFLSEQGGPLTARVDRKISATRQCGSIGTGGHKASMKCCLSSSGCKSRPAKGEPARAGSQPCAGVKNGLGDA